MRKTGGVSGGRSGCDGASVAGPRFFLFFFHLTLTYYYLYDDMIGFIDLIFLLTLIITITIINYTMIYLI